MQILYEDNHLIAVNKPQGQLTQADEGGEVSLFDEVKAFIKERDKKPGQVFLGLLHRLDRPVGGVVLFAKTSKGASRLSEQFRNHTIEKVYWAVVEGEPKKKEGTVVQWLKKDANTNTVEAFDHEVPDSQRAELSYRQIVPSLSKEGIKGRSVPGALIEVRPKTGRPHQIRVAMASLGTPILGDTKYGASKRLDRDIALFARSLSFGHPISKERVTITAEPSLPVFGYEKN